MRSSHTHISDSINPFDISDLPRATEPSAYSRDDKIHARRSEPLERLKDHNWSPFSVYAIGTLKILSQPPNEREQGSEDI